MINDKGEKGSEQKRKSSRAGFCLTHELMPSGPVAELESSVAKLFSTFLGARYTESRNSWVQLGRVGPEREGG